MSALGKRLLTADGFIMLKMYLEADDQLEQIQPEMRACTAVLQRRVRIYEGLGKTDLLKAVQAELERRLLAARREDVETASVLTDEAGRHNAERAGQIKPPS